MFRQKYLGMLNRADDNPKYVVPTTQLDEERFSIVVPPTGESVDIAPIFFFLIHFHRHGLVILNPKVYIVIYEGN